MKERLKKIIDSMHYYNSPDLATLVFGLDKGICYDAIIVAPAFTPKKLEFEKFASVTLITQAAMSESYLIEKDGKKIAWIITGTNESNIIDYLCIASELSFKKMIFVGAVGALRSNFDVGDICTPSYCIDGGFTRTYLKDSLDDFVPFERVYPEESFINRVLNKTSSMGRKIIKASVFCTQSVSCEYYHLDEIRKFGTDLIEMETAAFYTMADLIEVPSIALLVVSDNSATGKPLLGRNEEQEKKYYYSRKVVLPELIFTICNME